MFEVDDIYICLYIYNPENFSVDFYRLNNIIEPYNLSFLKRETFQQNIKISTNFNVIENIIGYKSDNDNLKIKDYSDIRKYRYIINLSNLCKLDINCKSSGEVCKDYCINIINNFFLNK
jgi:hypothetical protein